MMEQVSATVVGAHPGDAAANQRSSRSVTVPACDRALSTSAAKSSSARHRSPTRTVHRARHVALPRPSPHPHRRTPAAPACPDRADGSNLVPSSRSSCPAHGRTMGNSRAQLPRTLHHPAAGNEHRTRRSGQEGRSRVERMTGFEPATSTLARWRSSQLSYIRAQPRTVTGRCGVGKPVGAPPPPGQRPLPSPVDPTRQRRAACHPGPVPSPVDPNPPAPRGVSSRSATSTTVAAPTGWRTSCATRSPRSRSTASVPRLTSSTWTSPR
jgi:hypothetical protein